MSRQQKTILIGVSAAFVLVLNWWRELDAAAEAYLSEAITDNLVIYATARSLNGIISVIQSIELSVNLGAGVGIHLGEILDPLNDLIERFSGFVLYGLAGLGLQKMVLVATSSLLMKTVVTLTLVAGVCAWVMRPGQLTWVPRLVLLLLLVRFAFVLEVGVIAALDRLYFDQRNAEAHSALQIARESLADIRSRYIASVADRGIVSGSWDAAAGIVGSEEQDGITELAARAVVELIVITLIRGLLLPLAFIWLLVASARRLWDAPGPDIQTLIKVDTP